MKVLVCRINRKKGGSKLESKFLIERFLFVSVIVTFTLLIFVQGALLSPTMRAFLSVEDQLEGAPLADEEFLYSEGTLYLQILGSEAQRNLKVLVNGDEVARFEEVGLRIIVRNGDIVEIDGSEVDGSVEVMVASGSRNISSECLNTRVKVTSNVKKLVRVKLI